jgi:beta-phosphoglucomutase
VKRVPGSGWRCERSRVDSVLSRVGPSRPAAIVFDFDGVIVDSEAAHGVALAAAAELLALSPPQERPDWYVGLGDAECFRRMGRASGRALTSEELERLIAGKAEVFARLCRQGRVAPIAGALELLRQCAEVLPVAVCSGSRRADIEPVLSTLQVLPLLSALVTADDVDRTKPDPAPYLLTAARLRVSPCQCVAIEDSPSGIAAAVGAGYTQVYAVCHTFAARDLIGADHIQHRIADLSLAQLLGEAI